MTKKLSLDEIAERLALPKTTVYHWIKDLPLGRARRENGWPDTARRKGNEAIKKKYRLLREKAYSRGLAEYDQLVLLPAFRDFVVLYIAEGYKRSRHTASICNSDPAVVLMAAAWMTKLSGKPYIVSVQHHADQDPAELQRFWGEKLQVPSEDVRLQPKTNSGQLRGRVWRCPYGVASVAIHDTYFRARIGAWMDRIKESWR